MSRWRNGFTPLPASKEQAAVQAGFSKPCSCPWFSGTEQTSADIGFHGCPSFADLLHDKIMGKAQADLGVDIVPLLSTKKTLHRYRSRRVLRHTAGDISSTSFAENYELLLRCRSLPHRTNIANKRRNVSQLCPPKSPGSSPVLPFTI